MPIELTTAPIDGAGYFRMDYEAWCFKGRPAPGGRFTPGILQNLAELDHIVFPVEIDVDDSKAIRAQIHDWRWVVNCDNCRSDWSFAWFDNPVYMCPRCWNPAAGNSWRPIEFPDEVTREAIYAELNERPDVTTRHWIPAGAIGADRKVRTTDETAAELAAENAENLQAGD